MTDKMTIEQALKHSRRELEAYRLKVKDRPFYQREVDYLETVVEALEKQMPKKADGVYCNSCGWQVKKFHKVSGQYSGVADGYAYREEKHDYCESCGQKIDWESDTE